MEFSTFLFTFLKSLFTYLFLGVQSVLLHFLRSPFLYWKIYFFMKFFGTFLVNCSLLSVSELLSLKTPFKLFYVWGGCSIVMCNVNIFQIFTAPVRRRALSLMVSLDKLSHHNLKWHPLFLQYPRETQHLLVKRFSNYCKTF